MPRWLRDVFEGVLIGIPIAIAAIVVIAATVGLFTSLRNAATNAPKVGEAKVYEIVVGDSTRCVLAEWSGFGGGSGSIDCIWEKK